MSATHNVRCGFIQLCYQGLPPTMFDAIQVQCAEHMWARVWSQPWNMRTHRFLHGLRVRVCLSVILACVWSRCATAAKVLRYISITLIKHCNRCKTLETFPNQTRKQTCYLSRLWRCNTLALQNPTRVNQKLLQLRKPWCCPTTKLWRHRSKQNLQPLQNSNSRSATL